MARLAAYYREDFQYPLHHPLPKQKKHTSSAAYVFYDEPQGHRPLNDRHWHRSMGASDPNLTPPPSYELYDNAPTFYDATLYDDQRYAPRYKPPKDRSRKRFSYAEHEAYLSQRQHPGMWDYNRMTYPDNYYVHQEGPGAFYPRQDPSWGWNNPAFLSPPSPLDSGLSSQSSPSVEAESYPLARSHRHRACLCPQFNNDRCLSRFDSGQSSPAGYSVSFPTPPRPCSRGGELFAQQQARPQVRYGKLGIVGETGQGETVTAEVAAVVEQEKIVEERGSIPKSISPGSESPMSVASSMSEGGSVAGERRRATERGIRELEAMVARCGLGDGDLLDRAERRDLPTAHQRLARSSSDTLYETMGRLDAAPRAPPRRRAGLPDRVADDMALRKMSRRQTPPRPRSTTTTYMLCSAHFTPPVSVGRDLLLLDSPDVDLDDLSYRRLYQGRERARDPPQPPFGIPLRPPPPQRVRSDYLHAVPSKSPRPLCHPRGNPDVVRDDLAFRTLRKEEPDRIYCDIAQVYDQKR